MATNRSRTDFIVAHCSATPPTADIGVEQIRQWHVNERGWRDVGYHYVIRRNGTVEVGRNLREPGAHIEGFNNRSVGVCLVGGVDAQRNPENNYTPAQWDALWDLLETLCEQFPHAQIRGHRDFPGVTKACPCFDVQDWWLGTRIDDTRVSKRSRLARHLRAARVVLKDSLYQFHHDAADRAIFHVLEKVRVLKDEAFDG